MGGVATASPAATDILWQIGAVDSSTRDLALGPGDFMKFSTDPRFLVGRSNARRDWPYVQPGPRDQWAGGRRHVFSVLFNVAELPRPLEGTAAVRLFLFDSHSQAPPRIEVALNGETRSRQTLAGAGDASIRQGGPGRPTQLSFEFPAVRLRGGTNVVEIRNVEGSWFLYDAVQFLTPAGVRLGSPPSDVRIETVEDTVFHRQHDGKPTQVVRMQVAVLADAAESATIRLALDCLRTERTTTQVVSLRPGRQTLELDIPRLGGWPGRLTATLTTAAGLRSSATATVVPHRAWTVYLVPHSHVDIGYTDLQPKVLDSQKQFIRDAMDYVEQHTEFQGDARFCWNVEVLWAVKEFLRQADSAQRERFLRHVADGSIGLDALFANELTGLCTSEEMVRLIGYAGQLVREHKVAIDSAMITDVAGYSWGLIAAMGSAGIRYFDIGPNANARIGSARRAWENRPFYWIAPDGRHRVLTWLAPFGYARVWGPFEKPEWASRLTNYLHGLESNPDYPYDVARLRVCLNDNGPPPFGLCQFVKDWNARWESPRLVIGRTRDAFVALEKKFGDRIPQYAGDFSPYWEDGAGSSADETGRNRRAANALEAAEKVWAAVVAGRGTAHKPLPAQAFDRAWDNVLLYDEHTWGAHSSISQPDSSFTLGQWEIKQAFALDAEREADELVRDGLAALAERVVTGPERRVLVFNPSSWERTDLARVELPSGDRLTVLEPKGKPLPSVRSEDGRSLTFIASDVPPLGYRTYRLVASAAASRPVVETPVVDVEKGRLEGRYFSVRLGGKKGGGAEVRAAGGLLQASRLIAGGGFNGFLYCRDGHTTEIATAGDGRIELARPDSPDGAALVVRSPAPGCRSLVRKVEIHSRLPWMDITNTLDRDDVRTPEGLYFDFPFDGLSGARMRFDTAWTPVRLEDDLLPGACKNFFCVQDWIEISDQRQTVVLAPVDAPLVEIGEIHANTRRHLLPEVDRLRLQPPRVLSFVMNNYWFTNYRASQPGTTSFRYRLYRYDGRSDPIKTTRCGLEAREPFRTALLKVGNPGPLPGDGVAHRLTACATTGDTHSFVRVAPENVIITAMNGTDGGVMIRLVEIAGQRARVTLTAPAFGNTAERVDLWGRRLEGLEIQNGRIRFEMGPREIVTVRLDGK